MDKYMSKAITRMHGIFCIKCIREIKVKNYFVFKHGLELEVTSPSAKCTEICSEKTLDLSHLGSI